MVSDFCLIAKPITYARIGEAMVETAANLFDTAETVTQIELHNVQYERRCSTPAPASPQR